MARQEWTNACWSGEIPALPELGRVVLGTVIELVMDPGTTELTGAESPMGALESVEELPVLLESVGVTLGVGTEALADPGAMDLMMPEAGAEGAFEALVDIDGVPQIKSKKGGSKPGKAQKWGDRCVSK